MELKKSFIRCQKPLAQSWNNSAIGKSGFHLGSVISIWNSQTNSKGPEIRVDLYMNSPNAKQEFAALEKQKEAIEKPSDFHSLGII